MSPTPKWLLLITNNEAKAHLCEDMGIKTCQVQRRTLTHESTVRDVRVNGY